MGQSKTRTDSLHGLSKQHFICEVGQTIGGKEYHIGNLYLTVPKDNCDRAMKAFAVTAATYWWLTESDEHGCDHIIISRAHSDWSLWPKESGVAEIRGEIFHSYSGGKFIPSDQHTPTDTTKAVAKLAYKVSKPEFIKFEEHLER